QRRQRPTPRPARPPEVEKGRRTRAGERAHQRRVGTLERRDRQDDHRAHPAHRAALHVAEGGAYVPPPDGVRTKGTHSPPDSSRRRRRPTRDGYMSRRTSPSRPTVHRPPGTSGTRNRISARSTSSSVSFGTARPGASHIPVPMRQLCPNTLPRKRV